ncbi:glucosyltransferase [Didymosphaeria variabile]|uniref:Dol-P-Glc:Glc(2)Man(9)GlcNAc(2)-PP-Dol alpha-1,2-glucosyltransferase n=1 Tax=Didymosphaeria variabile TaxID=1932322 RepID=A0A9W8XRA4_9PLEO|nr:glucosyltransferase [Didymosphaeria variabile]KAJ4357655.1 glucosyltransferase [Didymosphaeria variabile]
MYSLAQVWALPAALLVIANLSATWYKLVSERVPEPYLIRRALRQPLPPRPGRKGLSSSPQVKDEETPTSLLDAHTALNTSLFPPLFFFSGLYYTDVLSTLVVLAAYYTYLSQRGSTNYLVSGWLTINVGVIALLFRQTNIFWVAVFPAGLTVVDTLKRYNEILDTSVEDAGPKHYFALLLYLPRNVLLLRPVAVVKAIIPYVVLLVLFAGFVLWNGGVVLGDKSAHVATIHLPQMLYIWPYLVFFSLPLTLPSLLQPILAVLPKQFRSLIETNLTGPFTPTAPSIIAATLFNGFAFVAVHFNTIVHPYTLADNRHYVFYVFRILLRYPAVRYIAIPVYYICALLTIRTLGASPPAYVGSTKRTPKKQQRVDSVKSDSVQISFVIVWTAATTLSVITAPLVEPRYFIIPWVLWRLHVPASKSKATTSQLALETVWLLAVNVGVGYMFLNKGFEWPNEPGKVQRFLW